VNPFLLFFKLFYENDPTGLDQLSQKLSSAIVGLSQRISAPNNPVQEVLAVRPVHSVTDILNRSLIKVADETRAKARELGFHAWAVERVSEEADQVLIRVARDTVRDVPPSPARCWHRGEGVVGQCWAQDDKVAINLRARQYSSSTATKWKVKSAEFRLGQTYSDFRKTTKAFMAIVAVPIKRSDHFLGCISVNIDRESRASFRGVWPTPLRDIMYAAAKQVAALWHAS